MKGPLLCTQTDGVLIHYFIASEVDDCVSVRVCVCALLKKKARGVLGLRGVTAQGVLWQHTRVLS